MSRMATWSCAATFCPALTWSSWKLSKFVCPAQSSRETTHRTLPLRITTRSMVRKRWSTFPKANLSPKVLFRSVQALLGRVEPIR